MTDAVICPVCEGVLVGEPGEGQWRCRCDIALELAPNRPRAAAADEPESNRADESQAPTSATTVEKICRVCGKNLSGHRRLKDELGYICLACNDKEKAAEADGLVPCAECGRRLRPAGLTEFNGLQICKKCLNDHKELNKFKPMPANLTVNFDSYEKTTLRNLLIVAGVLLLIIALAYFGIWSRR